MRFQRIVWSSDNFTTYAYNAVGIYNRCIIIILPHIVTAEQCSTATYVAISPTSTNIDRASALPFIKFIVAS